jgi:hypothetical protein
MINLLGFIIFYIIWDLLSLLFDKFYNIVSFKLFDLIIKYGDNNMNIILGKFL